MPASRSNATKTAAPKAAAASGAEFPLAAGMTALQAWADIGSEIARFVADRMQKDIEAQRALLACTTPEAMRQVQADFVAAAQAQYAAQTQRMLDLMRQAAVGGLAGSGTARSYDDVPV